MVSTGEGAEICSPSPLLFPSNTALDSYKRASGAAPVQADRAEGRRSARLGRERVPRADEHEASDPPARRSRGLKIRVVGVPIFATSFGRSAQAQTKLNWGEAPAAFQQGTVDGQGTRPPSSSPTSSGRCTGMLTLWHYVIDPVDRG